jgi:DNA-binding CsgD family transcriptional regulator
VAARWGVTEQDLRTVLELVDPRQLDQREEPEPDDVFPRSLLADFASLLGADSAWYGSSMTRSWQDGVMQAVHPDGTDRTGVEAGEAGQDDFWRGYFSCAYTSYSMRSGDYHSVHKLSDFSPTSLFFAHEPWAHYMRDAGVRHHICVPLPSDGDMDYDIGLSRATGSDFTERDRLLLQLMRPHLVDLHRKALALLDGIPDLTARQWQVMRLVSAGMTDAQVARRLDLAEATVGKHLEGIYARLGVSNRVAAVNRVFPAQQGRADRAQNFPSPPEHSTSPALEPSVGGRVGTETSALDRFGPS